MDERRLARNEALFRRVNEAIEAGRRGRQGAVGFICECGALGCNQVIEVTLDQYEAVRADPRRFVLAAGHETPGVEEVVERRGAFVVAQKVGEGASVAERTDPRRPSDGR